MLEGLTQRGETAPVRQPVGHDRDHDAGEDADQAEQRPQADDGEGTLPERQGIHHAAEQHALGDRHDAERNAGQHDAKGLPALDDEHRQGALVDVPDRHGCCQPVRFLKILRDL